MAHDRDLVSRIKGALRVLRPKQISYLTNIPVKTIKQWATEVARGDVPPNESVADDIQEALLGQFMGSRDRR